MKRACLLSLGLATALGCATTLSLRAQEFTFQTFTIQGAASGVGTIGVQGINDFDATSGNLIDTSGNTKAWVRDALGNVTVFVEPRDTTTPSFTVSDHNNDLGVVVGEYFDSAAGEYEGYFRVGTQYTSYVAPGATKGATTSVDGINNFGSFCGFTANPPFAQANAFVVFGGNSQVFTVNGSTDAFCQGINDLGVTVGGYYDSKGVGHGWVRNPFTGETKTIDSPGASTVLGNGPCLGGAKAGGTFAYGINDLGEIVGHYWDTSYVEHGFVLTPDWKFQQVDVPGAAVTSLGAVNNLGQITGHYSDSSCDTFGYIGTPKR